MRNRTIRIRVAEVIEGGTKSEFYADLRQTLDVSRRAANKAVSLCLAADTELMTGGKAPKLYTYKLVASEFTGVSSCASSICRAVESDYLRKRWEVSVGRRSAPTYRSFPWPLLHNKSYKMIKVEDQGEFIAVSLKLIGGWWVIRLAGGSSYRDQLRGLRQALSGDEVIGQKKVRGKMQDVKLGLGDSKIWTDSENNAVIGFAVRLPSPKARATSGVLSVQTMREEFIVCTKGREKKPFTITGDQVRKWQSERERKSQRLSQDSKSGTARNRLKRQRAIVSEKFSNRISTFCHTATSQIVDHARRKNVATVRLDMTVKAYLKSFPYFEFAAKLEYKCQDAGIAFENITQTVAQPDVNKPHVYFKYAPTTNRVKIGHTKLKNGKRHGNETDSSEELVILAVDNQPASKVLAKEKHHQAVFKSAWVKAGGQEWFNADPVIQWLRDVEWFGNAGNLSQIAQVLEV